jgi:hypothetical protein
MPLISVTAAEFVASERVVVVVRVRVLGLRATLVVVVTPGCWIVCVY